MGNIIILDDVTSNQIAAGEVIERPASVVKEMVENAIDAGSTAITVEIRNGGIAYIRVTDNGCGMEGDDVEIAFERHATSKLRRIEDLDVLSTMGFRGEALASIAAVSHLEVTTRTESASLGTVLRLEGGVVKEVSQAGSPKGTSFVVKNLFYNTPARYKFLKRDSTEAGYVSDILEKLALAHPHISFKLISNRQPQLFTPGNNDLLSVIYSIYGKEISKAVLPVEYEGGGIEVRGFVGRPEAARGTRAGQSVFLNGRYIKSKTATAALEDACRTLFMQNKFPFAVLILKASPESFDVNVHPQKLEVRFADEGALFSAVYHGVKNAFLSTSLIRAYETPYKESPDTAQNTGFYENRPGFGGKSNVSYDQIALSPQKGEPNVPAADGNPAAEEPLKRPVNYDKTLTSLDIKNTQVTVREQDFNEQARAGTPAAWQEKSLESGSDGEIDRDAERNRERDRKKDWDLDRDSEGDRERNLGIENESELKASAGEAAASIQQTELNTRLHPTLEESSLEEPDTEKHAPEDESRFSTNKGDGEKPVLQESTAFAGNSEPEGILELKEAEIVGHVFDTYIILQHGHAMFLIDQHAAHERIRYEVLKEGIARGEVRSQILIAPLPVKLSGTEYDFVMSRLEDFELIGFELEPFGMGTLLIRSVPELYDGSFGPSDFQEIVGRFMETGRRNTGISDETLYLMSCKSALKANRAMEREEIRHILKELSRMENPYTCVHGRPVIIRLEKKELEKWFKRIV